jgi:hypothetical protein
MEHWSFVGTKVSEKPRVSVSKINESGNNRLLKTSI